MDQIIGRLEVVKEQALHVKRLPRRIGAASRSWRKGNALPPHKLCQYSANRRTFVPVSKLGSFPIVFGRSVRQGAPAIDSRPIQPAARRFGIRG
jgi:hypothetical protein